MSGKIGKRFHGPAQVATGPATKYTVPASRRACVRHIHVNNPSGAPVTFTLSIGADAAATRIFDALSIAAGAQLDHYCKYDVEAAEVIQAGAGTNNILVLVIDGDEEIFA